MATIRDILDPQSVSIIQAGPQSDWRQIVTNLLDHLTAEGRCFSSGEIAAMIRTVDEKVMFRVNGIGEFLRDRFFAGTLPLYVDPATGQRTLPVLYVPRVTTGSGRTPAGQEVFIYAPDAAAGQAHDFEVDIPTPPGMGAQTGFAALPSPNMSNVAAPVAPSPTAPRGRGKYHNAANPVVVSGSAQAAAQAHQAVVQNDGRCRVGRLAFDAFVHATGQPLVGGQPVYLSFQDDCAVITTTQDPTVPSTPYNLSTANGEIRFVSPNGRFTVGDNYAIRINPASLIVDLSRPV